MTNEDDVKVRQWVAINHLSQPPDDSLSSNDPASDSSDDEQSVWASKHRETILNAADRFANSWKRPARKRKAVTEIIKAHKYPKLAPTTSSTSSAPTSDSHTTHRPRRAPKTPAQKQKIVNEPVKQYLQPTKMSRLNQSAKPSMGTEKLRTHINANSDSSEATKEDHKISKRNGRSNADNGKSDEQNRGCVAVNADQSSVSFAMIMKNVKDNFTKMNEYDDDLNDQDFLDGELSMLTSSTQSTVTSHQPSTPLTTQSSPDDRGLASSASTIEPQISKPPPTKPHPFLRQFFPKPISPTKYSPIPRLTPYLRVPTCFRIAEAIRLLKPPTTSSHTVSVTTIELFAAVTRVFTTDTNTTVQFADVFFPYQPPYIMGTLAGTKQLNTASTMIYRAIIRPLPASTQKTLLSRSITATNTTAPLRAATYHVQIEAIAQSSMDEIRYVRGIVDPEGVELEEQKQKQKGEKAMKSSMARLSN